MATQYVAMIDLKAESRALAFTAALEQWLGLLKEEGAILDWSLLRRKLNLAADDFGDFLLTVQVADLAQLDTAFRYLGTQGEEAERRYEQMHQHITRASVALYRPYPDPERAERLAIL